MALPSEHPKSRLMKKFNALGPYLRETQCRDRCFFFDCLAVCLNTAPSPEKREFWGWWMELNIKGQACTYAYHYGLYDKSGVWQIKTIADDTVLQALDETFYEFLSNLRSTLEEFDFSLVEESDFEAVPLELTV